MGTNKFSIRKRWLKNIWEKNVTTAFNFLYAKKEKIYSAYVSKHNSYCEKMKKNAKLSPKDAKVSPKDAKLGLKDDSNGIILP